MLAHQASRFLTGDWTSALGDEHGLLCQGYPVILYTLQVGGVIIKYKLMSLPIWMIIFSPLLVGSNDLELDVRHPESSHSTVSQQQGGSDLPDAREL